MSKQKCLIVLSSSSLGVSAPSFFQCYKLTQSAFTLHIATPQGAPPVFIDKDDQSTRCIADITSKGHLDPVDISQLNSDDYSCVVIPHCPGASEDLASCIPLANILKNFLADKKPICAVGLGVCGLLCFAEESSSENWPFREIALTGSSLAEVATTRYFTSLPLLPGDAILDYGGVFSTGSPGSVHVVVNSGVVTGQNHQSTLSAVQNMILLANQRQKK